jgi:chromosomal replication initiation ATPase DnaA
MTADIRTAIYRLQEAVAGYYAVSPAGMVSRSREQPLAFVRQLAMAVARDGCRAAAAHASDREIGDLFARTHGNVRFAAIAIKNLCAVEPATLAAFTHFTEQFTQLLNTKPPTP